MVPNYTKQHASKTVSWPATRCPRSKPLLVTQCPRIKTHLNCKTSNNLCTKCVGSVLIILSFICSCNTHVLHSITFYYKLTRIWILSSDQTLSEPRSKSFSMKECCYFCCDYLSHVISGVGFPVTLANKRNVPFSGTFSSSNLSKNRGGSGLSNCSSVIEASGLIISVSLLRV